MKQHANSTDWKLRKRENQTHTYMYLAKSSLLHLSHSCMDQLRSDLICRRFLFCARCSIYRYPDFCKSPSIQVNCRVALQLVLLWLYRLLAPTELPNELRYLSFGIWAYILGCLDDTHSKRLDSYDHARLHWHTLAQHEQRGFLIIHYNVHVRYPKNNTLPFVKNQQPRRTSIGVGPI